VLASVLLYMHIYINDAVGLHTAYDVKGCLCIKQSMHHNCDAYGHVVLCQQLTR